MFFIFAINSRGYVEHHYLCDWVHGKISNAAIEAFV